MTAAADARAVFACSRCRRVVDRLTEYAELLAGAAIPHVVCDYCAAEMRRDPSTVLDYVREIAS